MTVRRRGSRYQLVSKKGKVLGTHKTKAEAKKQERAIKASEKRRKGK